MAMAVVQPFPEEDFNAMFNVKKDIEGPPAVKNKSFRINLGFFSHEKTNYTPAELLNEIIKEINRSLHDTGSNSELHMELDQPQAKNHGEVCKFNVRTVETEVQINLPFDDVSLHKEPQEQVGPKKNKVLREVDVKLPPEPLRKMFLD